MYVLHKQHTHTSSCRSVGRRATGINTSSEVMMGYVVKDDGS